MKLSNIYIVESDDGFKYDRIIRNKWRELLNTATKQFGIHFDTENDDTIAIRQITIDQDFWDHTKCRFNCEMRKACGDWQCPVVYFRCQIVDGYANIQDKNKNDNMFIFIPNNKEGNLHLVKSKNGLCAPDNENYDSESTQPNEKQCWDSLKTYLKKLVYEEINNIKKNQSNDNYGDDS